MSKLSDEIKRAASKAHRTNVTFHLDAELVDNFKKACDDDEINYGQTLEALIAWYLSERSKKT